MSSTKNGSLFPNALIPPCKDCVNRHATCHSSCKKYAEFLKENGKRKEEREKIKKQMEIDYYLKTIFIKKEKENKCRSKYNF